MKAVICEHHRYDSPLRVGSHHVARDLARRGYRRVWLSHPRSWAHRLFGRLPEPVREHRDGTVEVVLRAPFPYWGPPPLGSLAWGRRWLHCLAENRRYLEQTVGERADLLWISDFTQLGVLDLLPADRVVFRYFDHLEQFGGMPHSIHALIRHHRKRSHLEVASSRPVRDALARRGIHAYHLPNGVTLEGFPLELALNTDRRREVVYVGALREWFDLRAVETFARRLPEVVFRLVGPDQAGLRGRLAPDLPNVVFQGPVDHDRLAPLLARARFGLIPFLRTPLTLGIHPLKLYEYLAAGLPVLSVDLPEVEPRPEGVFVYRDVEEGAALLARQVGVEPDRRALRRIAEANRWQDRLDEVFRLLA